MSQFINIRNGVGRQDLFDDSSALNQDSQIGQAHAFAGASVTGIGSHINFKQGHRSHRAGSTQKVLRGRTLGLFLNQKMNPN